MKNAKTNPRRTNNRIFRGVAALTALLSLILLWPAMAHALVPVTVAWDENDPVPAGYILYWGTSSRNYTDNHDVGAVTQYTVPDLQEGVKYYFAATAYDADGNESAYSEEISTTVGIYGIEASADAHGSITPAGTIEVNHGGSQTFTIAADQNYQILGVRVDGTLIGTASSYTFNNITRNHTIEASFVYVDPDPDTDGDGVPDAQDAFPSDPSETTDTDGDGTGNNADEDDDGDGMPDDWEIVHSLDPLVDDAAGDPDGDGFTNLEEYNAGTGPQNYEDSSVPDSPVILAPVDNTLVSLTPELTTDTFYDPDSGDVHAASRWQIFRASDNFCVMDVTSTSSLTALTVPKLILAEDTAYSWKVRFINNHDAVSGWSDSGYFSTESPGDDPNGNGVPDTQEVMADLDLDNDGVMDSEQTDIKCVDNSAEDVQIGVSIKDSENALSIDAAEIEDAGEAIKNTKSKGKPKYAQLGLIHFKIWVDSPGDETEVSIHLSHAAIKASTIYKYDPVNDEWLDYSDYAEFSPNRKTVYLTLKDGGFGDADGLENGVIVDPLTIGTEVPVSFGSGSSNPVEAVEDIVDGLLPKVGCFISTAIQQPAVGWNFWTEVRGRELAILFVLILIGYIGKIVYSRRRFYHRKARSFVEDSWDSPLMKKGTDIRV